MESGARPCSRIPKLARISSLRTRENNQTLDEALDALAGRNVEAEPDFVILTSTGDARSP